MGNCHSSTSTKGGKKASHTNFELHEFDPLSYIPEENKNDIRKTPVMLVHFVAHSVLQTGGNHWDIYLQTGDYTSVRIEMTPGAFPGRDGYLGRIDIIQHNYGITAHSHKTLTLKPTRAGLTVSSFLNAIVQADNHRYEFTKDGRGCGGWIRDQFHLFTNLNLIPSGHDRAFEEIINTYWVKNQSKGSWPLTYGTYLRTRQTGRKGGKKAGKRSKK
ncbi:hypothetical protein GGR57DRAFT_486340 [Xylariaceae sp. FL1272]|nr:hypothetical protein GGR57DRAFT_486340 [Xylariaceae sp. FL1272]